MSITTDKPESEDEKFADIVYTTDEEGVLSAPAQNKQEEEQQIDKPDAEKTAEKKPGKSAYLMDIMMVSVLVLIIGAGGFFIKTQMDQYAVPSPYEEAKAEYDRLWSEWDQLASNKKKVNDVQKIKKLQNRIISYETAIAEAKTNLVKAKNEKASIQSAIAQEKQAIDSARYNLREADRDNRAKALAELPGMPIGDVLNRRRNHIVKDAVINNLDMKTRKVQLRSSSDLVNWNIKDIAKKQLPPIVRYGLSLADLIDMSVLDEEGKEETPKRPIARREQPAVSQNQQTEESYDPEPGAPIISSGQTETISSDPTVSPDENVADEPTWDAPTGALPI